MGSFFIIALVALAVVVSAPQRISDISKDTDSDILQNTRIENARESKTDFRTIQIEGESFAAIVSDTDELRTKGLSGRKSLRGDEVMLFIFDRPDRVGFWMKDMLFSIDIVWVDENSKIISLEKNVSPETFPKVFYPKAPALYVLEFAAGTIDHLGVQEGDMISL
jgi:uncharacterized protein